MNVKIVIPICIGVAIIIAGIIAINNQEPEIQKSNNEIDLENKTSDNPTVDKIIDDKLNEIEKNAEENIFKPAPRDWQTSGPFQIDRSKYLIGEKIFLRIGALEPNEKGQIAFLKQSNETHYKVYQTIPFDGMTKNAFNYYTDVRLSQTLELCSIDDIVGEWTVIFRGTSYPSIKFEFVDKILPGEEDSFDIPVC